MAHTAPRIMPAYRTKSIQIKAIGRDGKPSEKTFSIDRNLFESCSEECARLLARAQADKKGAQQNPDANGGQQQPDSEEISLYGTEDVISFFVDWLRKENQYSQRRFFWDEPTRPEATHIHVFASQYKITDLLRLTLRLFFKDVQEHGRLPTSTQVNFIHSKMDEPLNATLYELFLRAYCLIWQHSTDEEKDSALPDEFTRKIEEYRRRYSGLGVYFRLCDFHQDLHSDQGRDGCPEKMLKMSWKVGHPWASGVTDEAEQGTAQALGKELGVLTKTKSLKGRGSTRRNLNTDARGPAEHVSCGGSLADKQGRHGAGSVTSGSQPVQIVANPIQTPPIVQQTGQPAPAAQLGQLVPIPGQAQPMPSTQQAGQMTVGGQAGQTVPNPRQTHAFVQQSDRTTKAARANPLASTPGFNGSAAMVNQMSPVTASVARPGYNPHTNFPDAHKQVLFEQRKFEAQQARALQRQGQTAAATLLDRSASTQFDPRVPNPQPVALQGGGLDNYPGDRSANGGVG
ncbi:uncharacterized protein BDZ99DRAFT_498720 [Mytilinidion resinicola]|uniref:Uncharacterized protein n=1 Tax=Mytilinidion resinicola TaxID=574789 RepID=A0A6A6YMX8_9PEZI|nr:uncharacterized protein BDZ99DRAFT_498720 [Mytilinidion resinicola]KAF2809325.1 hypothetical protein BDZ99DRAFT_498720 [Mytilinidion resinicola]